MLYWLRSSCGNLVEGLAELFDLVTDFDHAAAGFLR